MRKPSSAVLVLVLGWAVGLTGCSNPSDSDYQTKTQAVIDALAKVQADLASTPPAKTFPQNYAAATAAHQQWESGLTPKQKALDSAKAVGAVKGMYDMANANQARRGGVSIPDIGKRTGEALDKARELVAAGK